jgi:hypothetical protein
MQKIAKEFKKLWPWKPLGYEHSEAAGCKVNVLTCLRGKSAEELVVLGEEYSTWLPAIDAPLAGMAVMPQDHLTALLTGQYKAKTACMSGS